VVGQADARRSDAAGPSQIHDCLLMAGPPLEMANRAPLGMTAAGPMPDWRL
jgi:hypothetical protein